MKTLIMAILAVELAIHVQHASASDLGIKSLNAEIVGFVPLVAEDFPRGVPNGTMLAVQPPDQHMFMVVHVEVRVNWNAPGDAKEVWKGTLADFTVLDDQGKTIAIFGQFTKDNRLLFSRPSLRFEVREEWGQNVCRIDLLYVVPPNKTKFAFQVHTLKHDFTATRKDAIAEKPATLPVKVRVLKTERLKDLTVRIRKKFSRPDIVATLTNPTGDLMAITFGFTPQVNNALGGTKRFDCNIADFGLNLNGVYIAASGEVNTNTGQFSSKMHNSLQATNENGTTWSEQRRTLVFPVPDEFGSAFLTYLNVPVCKVESHSSKK